MATANSTGVRLRAVSTSPVVRGDSDPNMDEALRRVQTNLAYAERNRQLAAQVAREIEWGEAA